ncbi:MAG: molybdate ABC transporter permease subunit [Neisseriaceae bacterium]|nr:molybdate ABC transporter permease subunit [Neisseriaceae bacterium]
MSEFDWGPLWLTFKLAVTTACFLLLIGVPIAGWLAHSKSRGKFLVETLVTLPLFLPPSVLGFYLLLLLSPQHGIGAFLSTYFNITLVFSFPGLVIGSIISSIPFMVNPLYAALSQFPSGLKEVSYGFGKSRLYTFFRIELMGVRPALLTGGLMAFAHTIGEFGLVMMIGGNIPDKTRVASIAIYDQVELLNYADAHVYAGVLCAVSFVVVLLIHLLRRSSLRGLL